MAQQTQLTQSDLENVAKRHDDVGQQISDAQKKLAQHIQQLAGANHGEMMKSLQHVHEQWNQACGDIVKNLHSMAQNIRQSSQKYGQQDEDLAKQVGKVQTPQLRSFMGG